MLQENGIEVILTRSTDSAVGAIRDADEELIARTKLFKGAVALVVANEGLGLGSFRMGCNIIGYGLCVRRRLCRC